MEIEHATHDFAPAESATTETKQVLHDLQSAFEQFKEANDERLDQIEKRQTDDVVTREKVDRINASVDTLMAELRRPALSMPKNNQQPEAGHNSEYKAAFAEYIRSGATQRLDGLEHRTFRVSLGSDGGYVVPPELDTEINSKLRKVSAMRSVATIRQITQGNVYKQAYHDGRLGVAWSAEIGSRSITATGSFSELSLTIGEQYVNLAATQQFLDDAAIDTYAWFIDEVQHALAESEGVAFITGSGSSRPKGILNYSQEKNGTGSWNRVPILHSKRSTGLPTSNPTDVLIDLVYHLPTAYRQNAHWMFNRRTQADLRKIKDSTGNYLWVPPASVDQPPMLLGHPVLEDENMPNIGAGAVPILFADFHSAYVIVDRLGTSMLRDPYSTKPYILFYMVRRVGGGVKDFAALRGLKIAT